MPALGERAWTGNEGFGNVIRTEGERLPPPDTRSNSARCPEGLCVEATLSVAMQPQQGDIDLRLRGRSVSRLFIDHRLGLEFLEQGVETTLVIGGRPRLEHGGARLELSAEQLAEVGKASILVRKTVDRAVAHEDGSLEVNFMDGDMLFVGPDPGYEAWEAYASDGMKVISLPGGGLATWPAMSKKE